MDRTAWIAVTLCVIGFVTWEVYLARQPRPLPPPTTAASPAVSAAPAATPAGPLASPTVASASPASAAGAVATATATPSFAETIETMRNADVEVQLTNRGGAISRVVLLNHKAEGDRQVTMNSEERPPIAALVEDAAAPDLPEFQMKREGEAVIYERTSPNQIATRKKFVFSNQEEKDNYILQLDVEIQNGGAAAYSLPGYYVTLGSAAPTHANDYPAFTRLVWCVNGKADGEDAGWFAAGGGFLGIGARAARPFYLENFSQGADWAAVTNQFFTTLIAPLSGKASSVWGKRFEVPAPSDQTVAGLEGALGMPGFKLDPGQTYSAKFEIYSGPKLYHRLASLKHNEAEVMEFGIFKLVCQLLLNALNTLHSFVGNYAAAILALTVIVKLLLWPIQNKANRTGRQMSLLAPKMQELREKYKDDPTKMNQEVMKLYKEYGINPVGGCLPMLIQIPIFFGLFTMLRQAVELRNSSFLWIKDLSQPDTVARIPGLDWPLNVLPLLMAATNFWLMAITPKTGDPTQQRILMFMPIIFVVFCYNFAAALALYYTTQNLLTILQLYLNRRQPMPKLEKVAASGKRKNK